MSKSTDSNGLEKSLLLVLSLISLGLLVAIVFVWYSALNKTGQGSKPGDFIQPQQTETPTSSPSSAPSESSSSSKIQESATFKLNSPKNEDVIYTKTTNVSGTASPNSAITVTGGKEDVIAFADETGAFNLEVKLDDGQNDLTVAAFDNSGKTANVKGEQTVSVVYISQ